MMRERERKLIVVVVSVPLCMCMHGRTRMWISASRGRDADEGQISQWRLTFSVMWADNCGEKAEVPFVKTGLQV